MSPRPLLWVVVNVGANQKGAGSLVLHVEKVVESQVNVKVYNGAAERNGVFDSIKLLRRVVIVRIGWELFGGPFCNV